MIPSSSTSPRKRALSDGSDIHSSDSKRLKNMGGPIDRDPSHDVPMTGIDSSSNMAFSQQAHNSQWVNMTLNSPGMWHIHPGSRCNWLATNVYFVDDAESAFQNAHQVLMNQPSFIEAYNGGHVVHHSINFHVSKASDDIEKYRKWLMSCDPSTNQHIACEKHHFGTGLWFLENQRYMEWKENPNSFMWIHGMAGSGKTILFSTIVKNIQSIVRKGLGSIAMAYFYCDISDAGKRTVTDILRSLAVTLLACQPSNVSVLGKVYEDQCMNGYSKPSNESIEGALRELVSSFQKAYILIDALDECVGIGKVLEFIRVLHAWDLKQCHLLITSRKEQYIVEFMELMTPIKIDMSQMPIDGDIEMYIDHDIHSSMELRRWMPDEKDLIRKALLEKAKGMFRWVACQLDELKKCTKRKTTLQYILDHLPVTLEETYDQILGRISSADASAAVKLLLWLAFAHHPLHIDYLAIIVEFDIEKKEFNSDVALSSPEDVLSICSSLVTRMGDNTVQLAHASVKQYILERPRKLWSGIVINPSIGNTFIGQCCLTYMMCSKERISTYALYTFNTEEKKRYEQSLIRYSAKYWPKHILAGHQTTGIVEQMKEFFVLESTPFKNWVKIHDYEGLGKFGEEEKMKGSSLLHCAAFHGLTVIVEWALPGAKQVEVKEALFAASHGGHTETVKALLQNLDSYHLAADNALLVASCGGHKETIKLLLESGADVNAQGGFYGNALQAASWNGNKETIELLLERGADVNMQGGCYGNALQAASWKGYKENIELLLESEADVNAQGGCYGNALQAASWNGNKENIELLLERGADVNAQGGQYGNALQAASWKGHKEAIGFLLERGADVNAQGGLYGTALQAASSQGNKETIELLLEGGADVNTQGGLYGNALQAASLKGYKEIIELLLESGADVNVQGGCYGNALQAASWNGNKENIELLLESGADVNAQGGQYENALQAQAASWNRNKEVIELLLERGADVNAQGGEYGNALQAASRYTNKETIELLLEKGADANAQGGYYGNALQAASQRYRNEENIELLLERGANVNAQGGFYGNALQAASCNGNEETIELLLERGANVNVQGGYYGNALQAASLQGNKGTVEFLLKRGADVNAQGGEFGNALQAASSEGNKETIELLLERGADVNAQGGEYGNALQAASWKGHKETIVLLLERGADVNAQGGQYGNALQAASSQGNMETIELLLESGANVNAQGGKYGNSLQCAAFEGHITLVQLLLKSGANANSYHAVEIHEDDYITMMDNTSKFCNALQAASLRGHKRIVELLLAHGIEQEYLDDALCSALQYGQKYVVNLLLSHGAKQD